MPFCTFLFERSLTRAWRKRKTTNEADTMIPGQTILSYNDAQEMFSNFPSKIHVVGNAKSLLDKKLGSEIDREFTVRFNWPDFRKHPNSLGTRIDWLHTSSGKFLRMRMPKYFINETFTITKCGAVDVARADTKHMAHRMKIFTEEVFDDFFRTYEQDGISDKNQKPSVGLIFLELLNKFRPDTTVTLYGFDFKESVSHYVPVRFQTGKDDKWHNFTYEEKRTKQLLDKNSWSIK